MRPIQARKLKLIKALISEYFHIIFTLLSHFWEFCIFFMLDTGWIFQCLPHRCKCHFLSYQLEQHSLYLHNRCRVYNIECWWLTHNSHLHQKGSPHYLSHHHSIHRQSNLDGYSHNLRISKSKS